MAASTADAFAGAPLRTRLRGSLRRLGGILLLAMGIGLAVALWGFDWRDPSLNQATAPAGAQPGRPARGLCGRPALSAVRPCGLAARAGVHELGRAADAGPTARLALAADLQPAAGTAGTDRVPLRPAAAVAGCLAVARGPGRGGRRPAMALVRAQARRARVRCREPGRGRARLLHGTGRALGRGHLGRGQARRRLALGRPPARRCRRRRHADLRAAGPRRHPRDRPGAPPPARRAGPARRRGRGRPGRTPRAAQAGDRTADGGSRGAGRPGSGDRARPSGVGTPSQVGTRTGALAGTAGHELRAAGPRPAGAGQDDRRPRRIAPGPGRDLAPARDRARRFRRARRDHRRQDRARSSPSTSWSRHPAPVRRASSASPTTSPARSARCRSAWPSSPAAT